MLACIVLIKSTFHFLSSYSSLIATTAIPSQFHMIYFSFFLNPQSPRSVASMYRCRAIHWSIWNLSSTTFLKSYTSFYQQSLVVSSSSGVELLDHLLLSLWGFVWLDLVHVLSRCQFLCAIFLLYQGKHWQQPSTASCSYNLSISSFSILEPWEEGSIDIPFRSEHSTDSLILCLLSSYRSLC